MNEIKAALFEVSETIMSTRDSALEQHKGFNQHYKDQREGWNAAIDFVLSVILKKIKEVDVMTNYELFGGKCPYTGKECGLTIECVDCSVDREEKEIMSRLDKAESEDKG